ncbi:uncharacterized protein KY384_009136 [Bacidia gigantensis]|uniref:uncharacterized protein n=1 Tax=Bacidia gigantensis TaxID=2732470 RepID=UPI001D03A9E4|nr:uncharacterized protein KY384_009136 [Bacidia gigantensis]KAG8525492.1 hypothetical protein KY384_009136 [Bacidia gigantensis]
MAAATAALYVTKGKSDKSKKSSTNYPLDAEGKLSSASAATSLKHAHPEDLPAYPVVGLTNTESSAGAAASLANATQKPFEHWKPGDIPAANKAAHMAKDYKPDPLWQPELSAEGSKAALQAHREGADVKIWRPPATDAGQSAAGQAMRKKNLSPKLDYGRTTEGERRALIAAAGAFSGRRRSGSVPTLTSSYPDSNKSAANALKAATAANRPSKGTSPQAPSTQPAINAGKIHNAAVTNLSREMYTSHPPVAPELEEKKRQDMLRAASVSMAKKMFEVQQKQKEESAVLAQSDSRYAASAAGDRPQSSASSSGDTAPPRYTNLEEAAKKLAAERLAKLHDEHAAYRDYYGAQKPQGRRISIRGRRRASSDGQVGDDSDEERSRQIRNQMSLFSNNIAQVDLKKRKNDRESLMAAAQRNVRASMTAQDARVFNETGKVSPAMMAEWEAKAKAKAEADSESRMVNHGMVSIGGGKFLDQSEVNAIAAAKVQPTLDEITETAERHRERDEELRQQQLEREHIAAEKAADDKERAERTKEDWRKFRDDEKQDEKARKEEAKARRAEEKRAKNQDSRKSGDKTAIGRIKSVLHKDETEPSNTGNQEALEKLEGKGATSKEERPSVEEEELTSEPDNAKEEQRSSKMEELVIAEDAPVAGTVTVSKVAEAAPTAPNPPAESTGSKIKPEAPVAERIAPPVVAVAPSTETTVTGPSTPKSPTKEKDSSRVSTWLKNKLGRRTSKAVPTFSSDNKPIISEPKDPQVFIGSTNLGAPDIATTATSSEPGGDSSMREVALAGKDAGPVDAPVVSPESEVDQETVEAPMVSGGLASHPPAEALAHDDGDDSTSISSLSSDEDTRGRSSVRLADQIAANQQGAIFGSTAATTTTDRPTGAATKDFAPVAEATQSSSVDPASEEFEEAKDQFDESAAPLPPPDKTVLGSSVGEGRKSDSPARDRVEDLSWPGLKIQLTDEGDKPKDEPVGLKVEDKV